MKASFHRIETNQQKVPSQIFGSSLCILLSYSYFQKAISSANNPAGNYMFKTNNRSTRRCEICSKLTIKTPELATIVNFEQVIAGWEVHPTSLTALGLSL